METASTTVSSPMERRPYAEKSVQTMKHEIPLALLVRCVGPEFRNAGSFPSTFLCLARFRTTRKHQMDRPRRLLFETFLKHSFSHN